MWNIKMFGQLYACNVQTGQRITRYRTRKTGLLLAYLAYHPKVAHPREILSDLLWPEANTDAGRHSLCMALSSLRQQFDPLDPSAGSLLLSNRFSIQINPDIVETDIGQFEAALRCAAEAVTHAECADWLCRALDQYAGILLPGYYEEWVIGEQQRLQERAQRALHRLSEVVTGPEQTERTIGFIRRALTQDPLHEENQRILLTLLLANGQPSEAGRQYQVYASILEQELQQSPSPKFQKFVQSLNIPTSHRRVPYLIPVQDASYIAADIEATGLEAAELEASFPSVSEKTKGRLPLRLTRFFGREPEQARLYEMLQTPQIRLVTLAGPGGIGKTRLALEAAEQLMRLEAPSIWFAALSDASDVGQIEAAVLDSLAIESGVEAKPYDQIVSRLSKQPSLLILDTFEHLVQIGAEWVHRLLASVPTLTILITSRQVLNLSGEAVFRLDTLPFCCGGKTVAEIAPQAAVRLFVDRAQSARPDFQITPENALVVAELCDRLEGIPLAIELAAARVSFMTLAQMANQMNARFDLLVSRKRDAITRQRTLRDTLQWSYRLLTPQVQSFFANLSVFRNGWTGEAASLVCGEPLAPDLLAELQECSLIVAEESEVSMRFRMLDTMREFAQSQHCEEEQDTLRECHAAYFLQFVETAEPRLKGEAQAVWMNKMACEHDNIRAVLAWCCEQAERDVTSEAPLIGLKIVGAIFHFWYVRGHQAEGRTWTRKLLVYAGTEENEVRAKALNTGGCLAWAMNDFAEARTLLEACLEIRRNDDNLLRVASVLNNLALVARAQEEYSVANAHQEEALAIQRRLKNTAEIALSLNNLAGLREDMGDHVAATALYEESVRHWRKTESGWGTGLALSNLANQMHRAKRYVRARRLLAESLKIQKRLGDIGGMAETLFHLAQVTAAQSDMAAAAPLFQEAMTHLRQVGDHRRCVEVMHVMCDAALVTQNVTYAGELCASALTLYSGLELRDQLSVVCLRKAARVMQAKGDLPLAACYWAAAERHNHSLKTPLALDDNDQRDWCALEASLNAGAWAAAQAFTKRLTWEQAAIRCLEALPAPLTF